MKNNILVLADTRQQKDKFITNYFDKNNIEIVSNLCQTTQHERIKREISKARELGCKKFIFLICDNKIKTPSDLLNWSSKRTKVKGETICKIMKTMQQKYDIKFLFTSKQKAGKVIIDLLTNDLQN